MASRLAFFAPKDEIEGFFNLEIDRETLTEPHYNLTPGYRIPAVYSGNDHKGLSISRARWGGSENGRTVDFNIPADAAISALNSKNITSCILPVSGYYIWRGDDEKGQPFFVRLLNFSIMPIAGLYHTGETPHVQIITTEANNLIQPMSDTMPWILNKEQSLKWLETPEKPEQFIKQNRDIYLLTDYSVLKISKKVNDPSNNNPQLIQPIPK